MNKDSKTSASKNEGKAMIQNSTLCRDTCTCILRKFQIILQDCKNCWTSVVFSPCFVKSLKIVIVMQRSVVLVVTNTKVVKQRGPNSNV